MSLSNITVSGTLKKDPEKRYTPSNIPVTNLTVEICYQPRGMQGQDNISSQVVRVNAWRDLAEEVERKLKTGDKVLIIGKAQMNVYTNNEGKKKREVEIDANFITLLNDVMKIIPPPSTEKPKAEKPKNQFKQTTDVENMPNLEEVVINTEEIPF